MNKIQHWHKRCLCFILVLASAIVLAACSSPSERRLDDASQSASASIEKGMAQLQQGALKEASVTFNQALARWPGDANLHFLNGLTYHRMESAKGQSALELAETGYLLALQFNPDHWLAAWHLGLLQIQKRDYVSARKSLALAARLRPKDADIQLALAGTAYKNSEASVALISAEKALVQRKNDPEALQIAALASASLGLDGAAETHLNNYGKTTADLARVETLKNRIEDWKEKLAAATDEAQGKSGVQAESAARGMQTSQTMTANSNVNANGNANVNGVKPAVREAISPSWFDCQQASGGPGAVASVGGGNNPFGAYAGYSNSSGYGSYGSFAYQQQAPVLDQSPIQALPSPCKGLPAPRMAVVDITLIRTEELNSYNQGVNLLEGLKVVLSGSVERTTTRNNGSSTHSTVITRSLALPSAGVTYSLNIFNGVDQHADLIARPSLLALDRVPATFFSGSVLTLGVQGNFSSSMTDKQIGVSLAVTPTFIDDDRILLAVRAGRSFIDTQQKSIGFDNSLTTTSNSLSTNVVMQFGETLILSGLRERYASRGKSGVPVLQDIPVIQYLFSNNTESDYAHHVMIVITPRKPATIDEMDKQANDYKQSPTFQIEKEDSVGREAYKSLKTRRSNMEAVLAKLQTSHYRHEFRTGDLSSRRFAANPSLERVLQDLRQMLYY